MANSIIRAGRRLATVSIVGGGLLGGMIATSHAQQSPVAATNVEKPATVSPEEAARTTLRSETRIRRLHDKLGISSAQEALWAPVAQVMRDNEVAFRAGLKEGTHDMKSSTATNDLKTFQIIADHHAEGLKKLIPAFDALYESLPPAQQKRADRVFAERSGSRGM